MKHGMIWRWQLKGKHKKERRKLAIREACVVDASSCLCWREKFLALVWFGWVRLLEFLVQLAVQAGCTKRREELGIDNSIGNSRQHVLVTKERASERERVYDTIAWDAI